MDSIVARFQPRALHSDLGYVLWRVVDTRDGVHVAYYTREALARLAAARMNSAFWAEAAQRQEAGTW